MINSIIVPSTNRNDKNVMIMATVAIFISDWWFGTFQTLFIFPYLGNFIIPTDELYHFSEGQAQPPTNQQMFINHWVNPYSLIPSGNLT